MIGQTINQYHMTDHLGAGGMGDVYLAVDSKLDRNVALKFLPPSMSAQPDAKARFLQEARTASALNHPNVCTIYDIQEHDGRMFIVMEYVEGKTLRDHAAPFSIKQVVEIGIQVADGLAAAHEKGIVHRDIKTENIMIRKDGIVQIMDFGLAKLRGASRLTKEGSTVGTAGYMSPEQVQGLDADHRTDLFSLGVVLYELIAGQMPFKGVHETAIMYEIVNVDPQPLSAIQPDIDPEFDRIILDCLQKDVRDRCQSASELSRDLRRFKVDSGRKRVSRVSTVRAPLVSRSGEESASAVSRAAPESIPSPGRRWLPWIATVLGLGAAALFAILYVTAPEPPRSVIRAAIQSPEGTNFMNSVGANIALSPDGQTIVFLGADSASGNPKLWVRPLHSLAALPLPGTEDATYPFWSPDGRYIGFFAGGKLKKIQAGGGPALTICDAAEGRGGSWSRDDVIIFSPTSDGAIFRVAAAGGAAVSITTRDTTYRDVTHRWPHFLPDGRHFLYFARTGSDAGSEEDAVCLTDLEGKEVRRLLRAKSNAVYAAGYLLFMRESTLMAQPFDPDALEFTGDAFPLAEKVAYHGPRSMGVFSASAGALIYISGDVALRSQLAVFDREGKLVDSIGSRERYSGLALAPGGDRLAVSMRDEATSNGDIWIYDLARGIKTRLTFDAAVDDYPVWSPDGRRILFRSPRNGKFGLYVKDADGTGQEELLLESQRDLWPNDWSADGQHIIYEESDTAGVEDLWFVSWRTKQPPQRLTQSPFEDWSSAFSPDGRWLAYVSLESGTPEVYVTPFPGPGGKWQVSVSGGDLPHWRGDGNELFYLDGANRMMAAEVDGGGGAFKVGNVKPLFKIQTSRPGNIYDVSADGRRFFVNTGSGAPTAAVLTLVLNWPAELKQK